MKKVLKITGIGLAAIIAIIVIALAVISISGIPSYDIEEVSYAVDSSPEAIERGQKLSMMLCASCHMNQQTGKLTGGEMLDLPKEFGMAYASNITQDTEHGIGGWSDGDLVRILRTGLKKDGQYSPPYMMKLPLMADEDINAIIAFLRSDSPMVAADPTPDKECDPSLLTKFLCRAAFKPFAMPENAVAMPDTSDAIAVGEYLSQNLGCFHCHSADFKTNNDLDPTASVGYFGGGNKPLDRQGRVKTSSNLTPDPETGIGKWSKEDFIKAVKYGQKAGEPGLVYPMMPYVQLTDQEAGAIYDYLMTIPPIKNKVERNIY